MDELLFNLFSLFFNLLLQLGFLLFNPLVEPFAWPARLLRIRWLVIAHGATSPGFITHTLPCARNDWSQSRNRFPTCCWSSTSSILVEIVSSFGGATFCLAYSGNITFS